MNKKETIRIIKNELKEVVTLMGIDINIESIDNKDFLVFKIIPKEEKDISLLVGKYGQTLDALQYLLKIILIKKLEDNYQLFILDIDNYRQKREDYLKQVAQKTAEKVKTTGYSIVLDPLPAFERRIVHLSLADFSGIHTESIGEGEERRTVVKLAE